MVEAPNYPLLPSSRHRPVHPPFVGCLRFANLCWVGKPMNIIMKPTNSPTQEEIGLKLHLGHFFPQQMIFGGLGLALCRKQTARSLTQSNSPQTP